MLTRWVHVPTVLVLGTASAVATPEICAAPINSAAVLSAGVWANRAISTESADPCPPANAPRVLANRPLSLADCPELVARSDVNRTAEPGAGALALSQCGEADPNQPLLLGDMSGVVDDPPRGAAAGSPTAATARRDDPFVASIDSSDQQLELLVLPRNGSLVLNTREKVDGVSVGDPTIVDVAVVDEARRVVVRGLAYGNTQIVVRSQNHARGFRVSVELDLRRLADMINAMAPNTNVQLRSVGGTIVLMGSVPDAQTAERVEELASLAQGGPVKNQLTVAGVQQTMLRVVVAEVVKQAMRELSVNWAIGGNEWSRDFFFANNLNQLNPTVFTSSGLPNVLTGQNLYSVGAVGNGVNSNITFGFPRGEFQMFINALRSDALARVLAEPNLVAISGQTASFLAGGEVPIPVTQGGATAGSITIDYKEFGVRLAFTPTVLGSQIIRLHVMTEVSDAVPEGVVTNGLPTFSFTTRRVESTIECGNGQTFAIAGLLREQVRALADKIPGIGDVPVLGALFSSTSYRRDDTELVVLVTPQLVEPLDPQQVAPPPGSLMTDPNDFELFTLQKLEGTPLPRPEYEGVPRDMEPVNARPTAEADWPTSQLALRGPWGLADAGEN